MSQGFSEEGLFSDYPVTFESKIRKAVETLQHYEELALEFDSEVGYNLCFSGGKDSVVIMELAKMAGVKFAAHYNVTGIDPPELVRFIKEEHPDVKFNRAPRPFFKTLVESKGIPTRKLRWCCAIYKEQGGSDKVKILGVRAAESTSRKEHWRILTPWKKGGRNGTETSGWCVAPILHWSDKDVWKFIKDKGIPYCKLYDEGFKRLGCIGCPMAMGHRREQFVRWPKYEAAWKKAFEQYWTRCNKAYKGKTNPRTGRIYFACRFESPEKMWEWWMSNDKSPDGCNMGLF